ncbi:ParA family protein [Komagataeibacter sp. FNDCF1]|uniref:ParA family protein n=1 Tax=Komagataeibacter sp. FNDCF1 TaxID=2878681 RepID=UPI001E2A757D|nr:ParA family protein [Komagataeibacter sp. FNDCF1]MCE2566446.1 ParA family protein [Komagataeibacter sp. FNDCF1]
MKILAIAMQKGGVAKSWLTRSLSVVASHEGLNVLVIDMDSQQSTVAWSERREAETPLVQFSTERELPAILKRASEAGCDLVFIDTPPARSTEAPAAVDAADMVLIPCTPDIEAYEQVARTERLARLAGKPALAILTMTQPSGKSEQEIAQEVFASMNLEMALPTIARLKAHRDAAREGRTATETEADSRAAREIAALWMCIKERLNIRTSAIVHNCTREQVQK